VINRTKNEEFIKKILTFFLLKNRQVAKAIVIQFGQKFLLMRYTCQKNVALLYFSHMIKKIDIAGIELDNYTVREAIMNVEKMLGNNVFNTLEEVSMDTIMLAETNEKVKSVLASLDYTIIAETGILDAVGEKSLQREHEIKDRDFFFEFFKRIERNHKSLFLVGESAEDVKETTEFIQEEFPRIKFIGSQVMEECIGTSEKVVNDINASGVDVILSVLPSPAQEAFLFDNKDKLSASLWYGVGKSKLAHGRRGLTESIKNLVRKKKLTKHINNYEEKKEVN